MIRQQRAGEDLRSSGHIHNRSAGYVQRHAASQGNDHQPGGAGENIPLLQGMLLQTGGAGGENRLPLPRGGTDGIVRGVQTGTHGALKGLGEDVCQIRQGDERIPLGSSGSCQRGQRQQKPKQEGGGFFHKDSFLQIAIAP